MVRFLERILALVAIMASAINAQCAMSCSLQPIAHFSSNLLSRAALVSNSHACCPHQGTQTQKPQSDSGPCAHPVPSSYEAVLKDADSVTVLSVAAGLPVTFTHGLSSAPTGSRLLQQRARASSDLVLLASITVLRI